MLFVILLWVLWARSNSITYMGEEDSGAWERH